MPVGRRQPLHGEPAGAEHHGARAIPPRAARVDHAHAPGGLAHARSRDRCRRARHCASPYGKKSRGRSPTLPSTSRAPRAPVTITIADIALCGRRTASTGPARAAAGADSAGAMRAHAASPRRRVTPAVGRELWILRALLAKELLDLGDQVRGGQAIRRARHRRPRQPPRPRRASSSRASSRTRRSWCSGRRSPFRFCSNWRGGLAQIGEVGLGVQQARARGARAPARPSGSRCPRRSAARWPRGWPSGIALLAARRIEHAHDPGRSFVPGRADAQARGELGIVGAARRGARDACGAPRRGARPSVSTSEAPAAPGQLEHARRSRCAT